MRRHRRTRSPSIEISVPAEMLQQLPEDLLRLMGYAPGAYSLGFIDNGRDPIAAIRPELEKTAPALGEGMVPLELRKGLVGTD
jgi:hypothetical protein